MNSCDIMDVLPEVLLEQFLVEHLYKLPENLLLEIPEKLQKDFSEELPGLWRNPWKNLRKNRRTLEVFSYSLKLLNEFIEKLPNKFPGEL